MTSPRSSIQAYIQGKDSNRPHLLDQAFTPHAVLRMEVRTSAIQFPAASHGREAIKNVLVRQFNQSYENVYTFCLDEPPAAEPRTFSCGWLVAMSEKVTGAVRVGRGRYDWSFDAATGLADSLAITIDAMITLPPAELQPVIGWVARLPYPWCSAALAASAGMAAPAGAEVWDALRQDRSPSPSILPVQPGPGSP